MKREVLILLFLLIIPLILAEETCSERKICFNTQQQNCLFLNLLPVAIIIILASLVFGYIFRKRIYKYSLKNKLWLGLVILISFILISFILGKLYIFNSCSV